MGSLVAFYVRASGADSRLRLEAGERLTQEPGVAFCQVERPMLTPGAAHEARAFGLPAERLATLSRELDTDVVWLAFQSAVDAFCYAHWSSGLLVRELVYGCDAEERTWERVSGAAEAWERKGLFAGKPPVPFRPGNEAPALDARETARAVAEHFRFAGWCLG